MGISLLFFWFSIARHNEVLETGLQNRKGEALMKKALIRFLTLISLATSLTGLATAGESKRHNATASGMQQQSGCASATEEGKKQKKEKKTGDRKSVV